MGNDYKNIKEKISLVNEIRRITGLKVTKQGETYNLESCPFCNGHDCFKISDTKNLFNCFQCDGEGDIFTFYEKYYDISSHEALTKLSETIGYSIIQYSQPEQTIINDIVEYYHNHFMSNHKAIEYQQSIRCHKIETIQIMKIGYTTGELHNYLSDKGYSEKEQLSTGLVKQNDNGTLRDFFIKGLYFYPHAFNHTYGHFTIKDPTKKYKYQYPNEYKKQECLFYNMPALNNHEIIIVEGENDALSLKDAGNDNVISINGQLSEKQINYIHEWIKKSPYKKVIYLAFDNDRAGLSYQSKLTKELSKYCIVESLEKYADNWIELRIIQFSAKYKDIDEVIKYEKDKANKVNELINNSKRHLMPLKDQIKYYKWKLAQLNEQKDMKLKLDNNFMGVICSEWFKNNGSYFVRGGELCCLFYDNQMYEITRNIKYDSLMYDLAGLNASNYGYKEILQVIQNIAYTKGKNVNMQGWIKSNVKECLVYINLCNQSNEILRLSAGKIEKVKNGYNSDNVLLSKAPNMAPIDFDENVSKKDSMMKMNEFIFKSLACGFSQRYFIIILTFLIFLSDFVEAKGLNKFSGNVGSGKTLAAKLLMTLIFGKPNVSTGSTASDYSEAAQSPMIVLDNLEQENINSQKREFLLIVGTGGLKRKRKNNTDSENIYERTCTQVITTSVEPFEQSELIQRTNEIQFSKDYWIDSIIDTEIIEEIKQNRSFILSGMIKIFVDEILPDFKEKRKKAHKYLNVTFKNHAKQRLNELYATSYVILEAITKYIEHPLYKEQVTQKIFDDWILIQNENSKNTEISTNEIIQNVEILLDIYLHDKEKFLYEFNNIEVEEKRQYCNTIESISFIFATRSLLMAFDLLSKNRGKRNKFNNSKSLGARLVNSENAFIDAQWKFEQGIKKDGRGDRHHKLTKQYIV